MRRVLTTTDECHRDVPPPEPLTGAPMVWQVYIDGQPFIGVPADEEGAHDKALAYQAQIVETGRYEYVDLALRPERRAGERRAQPGGWDAHTEAQRQRCRIDRRFSWGLPEGRMYYRHPERTA